MAVQKWSQVEVIFAPTTTTKICILDEADPVNKLISAEDLIVQYIDDSYILSKEKIEAILTGNITSHTHNQYLTAITKEMVEAVLIGTIASHWHHINSITDGVSITDLATHAAELSHLTEAQRLFLDDLMVGGGLTAEQVAVLNTLSVNVDDDLVVNTNLIVEGAITAYDLGDPGIVNYDMLTNWGDYLVTMTDWVVATPLLYDLYTTQNTILSTLDTKVDEIIEIIPGLGISGGGTLDANVTVSLDINNLSEETALVTDVLVFYRDTIGHFNSVISDMPFITTDKLIYTPAYDNISAISGGGLSGGGLLDDGLYLELGFSTLEEYAGIVDPALDYIAVFDEGTSLHKKLYIRDLSNVGTTAYTITLPAAATVQERIDAAVESTEGTEDGDYPFGWVLTTSANFKDLIVTHNLNKRIANATVFNFVSATDQQLRLGSAAFSGLFDYNGNEVRVQSLATIESKLAINLIFN